MTAESRARNRPGLFDVANPRRSPALVALSYLRAMLDGGGGRRLSGLRVLFEARGFDTFEANQQLGFADDLRDFEVAAQMLHSLNLKKLRLLSNNPDKVKQLEQYNIEVCEMVTTGAYISAGNHSYLKAKVDKANHQIIVPAQDDTDT